MNLVELTSSLAEKDSERSVILEEIQQLEALTSEGYVGKVNLSIYKVDHVQCQQVGYEITATEDAAVIEMFNEKVIDEEVSTLLKTKDVRITLKGIYLGSSDNLESDGDNLEGVSLQQQVITASIEGSEIPDDTELRTELEASGVSNFQRTPLFHLKASFDNFENVLRSKTLQLEQLSVEYEVIRKQVKQQKSAQNSSSKISGSASASTKAPKEKKKKRQPQEVTDADAIIDEVSFQTEGGSLLQKITGHLLMFGALGVEHKAYLLFSAAAAGIFLLGEAASV